MPCQPRSSPQALSPLRAPNNGFIFIKHVVESMFAWETGSDVQRTDHQQARLDQSLFTALLFTDMIRRLLKSEELEMRSLMYREPVGDVQKEYTELAEFRRVLGRSHHAIRHLSNFLLFEDLLESTISQRALPREKIVAPVAAADPKQPTSLYDRLRGKITDLKNQLDAIKEDVNEEIQVAIGAVQVQDAQHMKQQTQETVRQTKLTVALAVLAAIYLPMTLVTGIFGMNIKEISSDKTATYAWQVGVAWLVIFAFTAVGGGAAYVWWEKWKAKKEKGKAKKESDLEANNMDDKSGVKRRGKTDGRSGKGIRRWGQKAKQKAKTIRTSKRE
jgi:Mg2+ and Co2+ transporter CorA